MKVTERMKASHYESEFPISKISESEKFQSRDGYDEEYIDSLSKKIGESVVGQIDAIVLWHRNDEYIKLAGFCRTRAIKKLGHSTIKANVYEDLTEQEAWEISVVTNEDRCNLAIDEKVNNIVHLLENGITSDWIMEKYNLNRTGYYNLLSLKDMDITVRYCLHKELIQTNHAIELMRIEDVSKRLNYLKTILSFRLSVRDTKNLIKGLLSPEWKMRHQLCPKKLSEKADDCNCRACPTPNGIPYFMDCIKCSYFGGLSEPIKEEHSEDKQFVTKNRLLIGLVREYSIHSKFKLLCNFPIPKELDSIIKFGYMLKEVTKQEDINPDGTPIPDKEPMSEERIKDIEEHVFLNDGRDTLFSYWNSFKGKEREIVKDYYIELERYSGIKRELFTLQFKALYPKIYFKFSHFNVALEDKKDRERAEYKGELSKLKKIPEVQEYIATKNWIKENTASVDAVKSKAKGNKTKP